MTTVSSLDLTHFRCYDLLRLSGLPDGLIALTGPNGAGKTNILEAISLLAPGRGLRGALPQEIQNSAWPQEQGGWAVSAALETPAGRVRLGTGWDRAKDKRILRIDGQNVKSLSMATDFLSVVWLTPQMDRLFLDPAGARRRFFDRFVFAFDPGHAGRVSRYENALFQRSRLLREGHTEPAWMDSLESQMAETGTAIAAARVDFLDRLQHACEATPPASLFPRARLSLEGALETALVRGDTALTVEERFRETLRIGRNPDSETASVTAGPHRSDLIVHHAAKARLASGCSTGEQKALLIGLILAHARLIRAERGAPPVLLLDEVAAHLDDGRRTVLFEILVELKAQSWMTGTDSSLFSAMPVVAGRLQILDGRMTSQT